MEQKPGDWLEMGGDDDGEHTYLTFEMLQKSYALDMRCVMAILRLPYLSRLGNMPVELQATMNLFGQEIPVMDVNSRLGLPSRTYDEHTAIIVLNVTGAPLGLVVDRVTDVLTVSASEIDPPLHLSGGREQSVVRGRGRPNDRASTILDVSHLLYGEAL